MTVTAQPATSGISAAEATAWLALVQAQAAARQQLTQAAVDAVIGLIEQFDDWWDSDAITDLTRDILRQVQPAQLRAARLTDAYVARAVSKARGRTVRPVGAINTGQLRRKLPQDLIELLANDQVDVPVLEIGDTFDGPNEDIGETLDDLMALVDSPPEWREPADVYGRIADAYRWEVIANGASPEQAKQKARNRAEQAVDTDMSLAVREQETSTARKLGIKLYRRVLHPELAESGLSCGLCIVASDRVYSVERFKRELHAHCHCEMLPIENGKDPGIRLNEDDLESLYKAAGTAVGRDSETGGGRKQLGALKRVRVAVTEHGELGPILVKIGTTGEGKLQTSPVGDARVGRNRRQPQDLGFRSVRDYAKTQSVSAKTRAQAQLPAMIESLARWESKRAAGDKVADSVIAFHRKRITELRRLAG